MEKGKLTCVINVRNGAKFIQKTIQSVLKQSKPTKILVVDNHSADKTREICSRYSDVQVELTPKPMKLGDARNFSLSYVITEFVSWLDSDDIWEPNFAEYVTTQLERDPNLSVCCTNYNIIDEFDEIKQQNVVVDNKKRGDCPKSIIKERRVRSAWPAYCFRTRFVLAAGGFNPKLKYAPDLDLILRVSNYKAGVFIDKALVNYRSHQNQLTQQFSNTLKYQESDSVLIQYICKYSIHKLYRVPLIRTNTWYLIARSDLRTHKTWKNYIRVLFVAMLPPNNIRLLTKLLTTKILN